MKIKTHYTRGYCPIPRDQRLLAIYNKINKSALNFVIILSPIRILLVNIFLLVVFLVIGLLLEVNLPYHNLHKETIIITGFSFVNIFTNFLHILVKKEWDEVISKTKKSVSIYEETGLLESQVWKKPTITLIQDYLVFNYKIKPIIRKLFYQIIGYNLASFLLLQLIYHQ